MKVFRVVWQRGAPFVAAQGASAGAGNHSKKAKNISRSGDDLRQLFQKPHAGGFKRDVRSGCDPDFSVRKRKRDD